MTFLNRSKGTDWIELDDIDVSEDPVGAELTLGLELHTVEKYLV